MTMTGHFSLDEDELAPRNFYNDFYTTLASHGIMGAHIRDPPRTQYSTEGFKEGGRST